MKKRYFIFLLVLLSFFGCSQEVDYPRLAKKQSDNASLFYESSVQNYIKAISRKDLPSLHLELGKLYYEHGQYALAIAELKKIDPKLSSKFIAISYFKDGDYTNALSVFERNPNDLDSEYLYYFGLTCEKLNLFEQAIKNYSKISAKGGTTSGGKYKNKAKERIEAINLKEKGMDNANSMVKELVNTSINPADYSEAGAVVLLADEAIEILPENKVIYYQHFIIKILNERGREQFAEINIDYDSTYEKVELEFARTFKPDGNIVLVGEKNIRDVSRYMDFPLYSNARSRIISMPEISDGAVIEYKAKLTQNRMINDKDFNIDYPLQAYTPLKRAKFKLIVPKDKPIFLKYLNERYNKKFKLAPDISHENSKTVYSWNFEDVPQIINEVSLPPISEISPIILISSFDSWNKVYNWWNNLAQPNIKTNTEIKKKVFELTRDKKTDLDKAASIFNFCAVNIRYVAVEYGQAGYEPHDAGDIFKNKYGDCKDQSVLLVTMLRDAGLEAYPVLISTRDFINLERDFPSGIFNHAIAVVIIDNKYYFLDPTAETSSIKDLPSQDQDRYVLVFKENSYEIAKTPLLQSQDNALIYDVTIQIDKDDKIKGTRRVKSIGQYGLAQRFWLRYSPPEAIKQILNERVQEISIGANLVDYKIENLYNPDVPTELIYNFTGGEIFISAGDLKIFPELAAIDLSKTAKDKRVYPLDLVFLNTVELNMRFKFDSAFSLRYLPPSVKKDSKWFSYENSYLENNNEIIFHQKQVTKVNQIDISEYQEYKKFLEGLKKDINQRIVLEEKNG